MIIIEGRNEKSIKLTNLIQKEFRTSNIAIIDSVGYNPFSLIEKVDHNTVIGAESPNEVIRAFVDNNDRDFKNYDWVVFYVNAEPKWIEEFKKLDREYPQNFIVTIQNENGLTSVYYI